MQEFAASLSAQRHPTCRMAQQEMDGQLFRRTRGMDVIDDFFHGSFSMTKPERFVEFKAKSMPYGKFSRSSRGTSLPEEQAARPVGTGHGDFTRIHRSWLEDERRKIVEVCSMNVAAGTGPVAGFMRKSINGCRKK